MKKSIILSATILVSLLLSPLSSFAVSWPVTFTRHSDIVISAAGNYEPSGLAWNSVTNKLFSVCNTGQVTIMNLDGSGQDTVKMASYMDFEAITIADPNTTKAFIGLENRDSILEYDWVTRALTGRTWDLTGVLTGADNQGLEGLTFVPNGYHPFSASASGDLFFSKETGVLYVLYDGSNLLIEMTTTGAVLADYSNVLVADQEGIAVITNNPSETADIYLASDSGKLIGWFSGYPVTYYDADGDGVNYRSDCNDHDRLVSANRSYYRDVDGDGVGTGVAESFCLASPPVGYTSNLENDCNDNDRLVWEYQSYYRDYDGDGFKVGPAHSFCLANPPVRYTSSTEIDCNDRDSTILGRTRYYRDRDSDGLGSDASVLACSLPAGFVSNSDDLNDNDCDNDGWGAGRDCDDNNYLYQKIKTYYQDADGDGLGSKIIYDSYCVPPANYVTNKNDTDDTIPFGL